MSARITASLGLDTQSFQAGLSAAESQANTFAAKMRLKTVGIFSGKSAQESGGEMVKILAAQEKLAAVQKANAFNRLSSDQQVLALETEIAAAKARVAAIEGVSTEKIALQLRMEEQIVQLERIRAGQAAARATAETQAAAARASTLRRLAAETPAAGAGGGSALGGFLGRGFGLGALIKGVAGFAGIASIGMIIANVFEKISEAANAAAEKIQRVKDTYQSASASAANFREATQGDTQKLNDLVRQARISTLKQRMGMLHGDADGDADASRNLFTKDRLDNTLAQRVLRQKLFEASARKQEEAETKRRTTQEENNALAYDQLSIDGKILTQTYRAAKLREDAAKMTGNAVLKENMLLKAGEADLEVGRLRLEIDRERTAEAERQADLRERQAASDKKLSDAQQKNKDAQGNFDGAKADRGRAVSDALGFTVGEAAGGQRGNSAARARARAIQRAEATALRLHDSGATVTEFDSKTQRNVRMGAADYQARALALRSGASGLTSAEQNPFASADKSLSDAGEALKAAAADLKNVTIEVTD